MAFESCHQIEIRGGTFNAVEGDRITTHYYGQSDRRYPLSILSQHAALNAIHNSEQRYPPPKCHPETRCEILERLSTWIQRKDRSKACGIYWVYGTVGVGKSAIAQTLCEKFAGSHLAASFFFSRTDPSRNHIDCFVATIAHQLATSKRFFTRHMTGRAIKVAVKKNRSILRQCTVESTFKDLILRPCKTIPGVLQIMLPNLVIVDGLDECLDIVSQERLLSLIWTAVTSRLPCPLDFLIFSRPESQITNFFNRISMASPIIYRMGIGDSFETDRDLATYLQSRFCEILAKHRHAMQDVPDSWPGPGVISQLVQRACGQFVYVTTVTKYIDTRDALPTQRLEGILAAKPAKPSPYAELDLLYHQVLRNCHDFATVLQILQLVLEDSSDIAINEPWLIAQVLDLDRAMIPVSLVALHSVLHVPESDISEPIRVLHASFSEFLRDAERSQEFFIPPLSKETRLRAYFLSKLNDVRTAHCLSQSWPGQAALVSTIQRAGGKLVYLKTVIRYLAANQPQERLDAILRSEPDEASPEAPLYLLYSQILDSCQNAEMVLQILPLLVTSGPEISLTVISQALGLKKGAVSFALRGLDPVLRIPDADHGPISIRHRSFSDFLLDADLSKAYHVRPLASDKKVEVYLRCGFEQIREGHSLSAEWPGNDAVAQLVQWARGQEIYATVLVRYLSAPFPDRYLNTFLSEKSCAPFQSLHPELDALYHHILHYRILKRNLNETLQILLWVIRFGSGPHEAEASPDRIGNWLGISAGTVRNLLRNTLHSVVLDVPCWWDDTRRPVRFLHPSFPEFLLDRECSREFYVGPGSSIHEEVTRLEAMMCLEGVRTPDEM
ncbi:nwd2 [Moniliophthora roreri]|uniref:Nephrocystin 3-like N-terminal domain-containing protein n=1 Tax=Moniliophthora roreri TaxID=221103 RepID=A0A0W0F6T1_MONRR|nr:nwd2 [Moniliophthora roreri]